MDKTLLEEIENLIKTSILGESEGDSSGTFDRYAGGWGVERSNSLDPASREIDQNRLKQYATNSRLKSATKAYHKRPASDRIIKTGGGFVKTPVERYEANYVPSNDTINWSPALLGIKTQSGDMIGITPETKSFLENLIGTFKDAAKEDGTNPAKIDLKRLDVKVDNASSDAKKNQMINLIQSLMEGLPNKERAEKLYLSDIRKIITNDKRFFPPNYQITLEAKNEIGPNFDDVINSVESFYKNDNSVIEDFSSVKKEIESSHSRVVLTIKRQTTLLPLYLDYDSQYVPRRAKVGALAKYLWACNQYRKIDDAMAKKFLEWREKKATTPKEKIELARQIVSQLENQYVKFPSADDHRISMDPEALIQIGREIGNGGNNALAVTSDTGWSYILSSKRIKNGAGKTTNIFKYKTNVSKNSMGRCTTDFLEGQTTKDEYLKDLDNLGVDDTTRSYLNDFVLNDTYESVYTLKMMYGDTVDVRFETDLPKSVYDQLVKLSGGTNISSLIKVPGSQFFTKTKTYAKSIKKIDGEERTTISTEAYDIINKGSGSAGFLKYINGHKQFGKIDDLSESVEDFTVLGEAISTLMNELYYTIDDNDYSKLRRGESIKLDDDGNNIIDPTNSKISSIIERAGEINPKLLFPTNEENIDKKISDFNMVHEIVRQLQTQCSKVIGRLVSENEMTEGEAKESNLKLVDITTGLNQIQAGFPTNVKKIYEGVLQTVRSTSNYADLANKTLIGMNIDSDLGKMLKAYFLTIGTNEKSVNFIKYKGPPALFKTDSSKLNFGRTRRGVTNANRQTLVDTMIERREEFYEKIMGTMSEFYENKMTGGEVKPRELATKSIEILHYLYDWYKTIFDLTKMDGLLKPMKDLLTVDVDPAMMSGLSVSTNKENNAVDYIKRNGTTIDEAVRNTLLNAKKSDIIQGIAISDYCKEVLSPAVRLIKKAISTSEKDRNPIVFSPTESQVPLMPIHTIVTTVNYSDSDFDFVVLSSVIGFSENADDFSDYQYTYDDENKELVVKNENGVIGPSVNDTEEFKEKMQRVSNAHFTYALMDKDSPVSAAFISMNSIDQRARHAFYNLRDSISKQFDLSRLMTTDDGGKRIINNVELEAVATKIFEDSKMKNEFMTILKYMYMMATVVDEF